MKIIRQAYEIVRMKGILTEKDVPAVRRGE